MTAPRGACPRRPEEHLTLATAASRASAARVAPVLQVTDLSVSFPAAGGDVTVVRGVSLQVHRGEVLGLVGESGSGKSVTALAVMGLLPSNAGVHGSVKLHGQQILGLGEKALSQVRGSTMSMVFQDPLSALTPVYTVGGQLAEAVRLHQDVSKQAATARAIELLDLVGIPHPAVRAKAFPHEFSGGMRQRVMIAMAIANDPDLIICDEPTTALDVTVQAQVLEVLKKAQQVTGAAILMITHDLGVVAGFADRMVVLYAGKPVEVGDVDDLYYHPRMPYTMGLLGSIPRVDEKAPLVPIEGQPPSLVNLPAGCPFVPRCPLAVDICRQTEPALLPVGTGGHVAACHRAEEIERDGLTPAEVYPLPEIPELPVTRVPRQERASVLAVDNLVRHYPLRQGAVVKRQVASVHAVDGISFDVRQGETFGLVGESGCGKTTTLLEILQLTSPQAGTVVVLGEDTGRLGGRDRKRLRRHLQVVFQDPLAALDPRLPVGDILAEPLRTHRVGKDKVDIRVRALLRLVGLEPGHANRYPQDFSGGQRQRIGIARALALEPQLVLLDEPVSALDVSIRAGILNLLEDLKARLGLSYLFVAHDLAVVRHLADQVAVMYLGKIVEVGGVDTVFAAPAHPYTQALLSAVPVPDPATERQRRRILLHGDPPSPTDPPSGCRFRTRCPKFTGLSEDKRRACLHQQPALLAIEADHQAACHYADKLDVV